MGPEPRTGYPKDSRIMNNDQDSNVCLAPGCERLVVARGHCGPHYEAMRLEVVDETNTTTWKSLQAAGIIPKERKAPFIETVRERLRSAEEGAQAEEPCAPTASE